MLQEPDLDTDEIELDIIAAVESFFAEVADDFDLHPEQIKAVWLSKLSEAELQYAQGRLA